MRIDFFFAPGSPWCWITSRWLVEVQRHRDLDVHWRTFSLLQKNRELMSPEQREGAQAGHTMLRVAEALRVAAGEEAVGAFYAEFGARVHHDTTPVADVEARSVLRSLGLPEDLADAAHEDHWDTLIEASMRQALALAGNDVGVPLIVFDGRSACFGPVMSVAPHGENALRVWDAVATMVTFPGFHELKNDARGIPEFASRPQPARSTHPSVVST